MILCSWSWSQRSYRIFYLGQPNLQCIQKHILYPLCWGFE